MSDVTGPISSMPGSRHAVPHGAVCDNHPDRPAADRVQGETDSMGCEMLDLCAECAAEIEKHAAAERCGVCDWCGCSATDLRQRRDYDEGMCGPIYAVCGDCVRKDNERAAEEWAEQDRDYY